MNKSMLDQQQEINSAMIKVREALENIFKTGHGELIIRISDKRVVSFDYKAQWQLRQSDAK